MKKICKRKSLTYLLICTLIFTYVVCSSINVLAVGGTEEDNTQGQVEYDGGIPEIIVGGHSEYGNINKTIQQTGKDAFEITVTVETKMTVKESLESGSILISNGKAMTKPFRLTTIKPEGDFLSTVVNFIDTLNESENFTVTYYLPIRKENNKIYAKYEPNLIEEEINAGQYFLQLYSSTKDIFEFADKKQIPGTFTVDLNQFKDNSFFDHIVTTNEGISAVSLTDPMSDYISYVNGSLSSNYAAFADDKQTITWDLSNEDFVLADDGMKVYTLTYNIILKTNEKGFVEGQEYPTNGTTTLYYLQGTDLATKSFSCDVPSVKGNKPVPGPINYNITATKALTGADLSAGQFEFVLKEGEAEVDRTTNDADGNIVFTVNYTGAGAHNYTISEVNGSARGYTYDSSVHDVEVTVTSNNGVLSAASNYLNGPAAFENTYTESSVTPDPINYNITATKALTGADLTAEQFAFVLKEGETVVGRTTNAANGTITFTVNYTEAGTHEYTISEVAGNDEGYTYDSREFDVTVSVTNNNGKLLASPTYPTGGVVFENKYEKPIVTPGPLNYKITAKKELAGAALSADQFAFVLKEGETEVDRKSNAADGTITFTVNYTEAGTHEYTISEVAGSEVGYTYDSSEYDITVSVTNNDGKLSASPTYPTGGVVFKNTYTAQPVIPEPITVDVTAEKRLVNKSLKAGEFSFQLKEARVQPQAQLLTAAQPQVATNAADGSITFKLTFSEEGRYYYTISEVIGSETLYEFDKTTYPVVVDVTLVDNILEAEVGYPEGKAIFNNKYIKQTTEPTRPPVEPTEPPTEGPTPTPTPIPTPAPTVIIDDEITPGGEIELDDEQIPEGSLPKTGGYPPLFYYGLGFTLTGIGLKLRRKNK